MLNNIRIILIFTVILYSRLLHCQEIILFNDLHDFYPSIVYRDTELTILKDADNNRVILCGNDDKVVRVDHLADLEPIVKNAVLQVVKYDPVSGSYAAQLRRPERVVTVDAEGQLESSFADYHGTIMYDYYDQKIYMVPFFYYTNKKADNNILYIFNAGGEAVLKVSSESLPDDLRENANFYYPEIVNGRAYIADMNTKLIVKYNFQDRQIEEVEDSVRNYIINMGETGEDWNIAGVSASGGYYHVVLNSVTVPDVHIVSIREGSRPYFNSFPRSKIPAAGYSVYVDMDEGGIHAYIPYIGEEALGLYKLSFAIQK